MYLETKLIPTLNQSIGSETTCFYFKIQNDLTPGEIQQLKTFLSIFYSNNRDSQIKFSFFKNKKEINNIKSILDLRHFYQPFSWVRIRNGIYDEENDIELSGFTGQIQLFFQDNQSEVYFVQWSQESFLSLPERYFLSAKNKSQCWRGIYIDSEDLLPIPNLLTNENFDLAFMNKFFSILNSDEKDFWLNKFNPKFQLSNDFATVWDEFFCQMSEIYHFRIFNDENLEEITVKSKIEVSGFDSTNGVWVKINNLGIDYIIPLNEILFFEEPSIQNLYSKYLSWCKVYLPD